MASTIGIPQLDALDCERSCPKSARSCVCCSASTVMALSFPIGLLTVAILHANNTRDVEALTRILARALTLTLTLTSSNPNPNPNLNLTLGPSTSLRDGLVGLPANPYQNVHLNPSLAAPHPYPYPKPYSRP